VAVESSAAEAPVGFATALPVATSLPWSSLSPLGQLMMYVPGWRFSEK